VHSEFFFSIFVVITAKLFISLPVAASVIISNISKHHLLIFFFIKKSHTSPSYFTPAAIALADQAQIHHQTARTPLTLFDFANSMPSCTLLNTGLLCTPPNSIQLYFRD
jgi:hypothetical protein